jgi:1-acyl-sn-glycerol-3-phosphate acyltransferase
MHKFYYYVPIVLQKVGYALFFFLYKIFLCIEIRGKENLKNISGPIILASNHTSELDVTAMPLVLPFFSKIYPIYFVANKTEKYKTFGWRSYFYGGVFFNWLGGYASHSGHKNYGIALADHIRLLRKGRTMHIFPEGKRTLDGNLNPARGGLGYMVYITGATVVPIAINTFFNLNIFDFFKNVFTRNRKVIITVLPPIKHNKLIDKNQPSVEDFRHAGQVVLDKIKEFV